MFSCGVTAQTCYTHVAMKTLFIADLHLTEHQPVITKRFLRFLEVEAVQADALYILGDFFNLWVGDDDNTEFNRTIINALRKYTDAGTPIYLMPGNRDFLIGKRFLKATGCKLLQDPLVINLYNTRILLTHGDIFCTHDIKYLIYRKFIRNWLITKSFLWLPLVIRKAIANRMRKMSQAYNSLTDISGVTQSEIEHKMRKYRTNLLIHGHIHNPGNYQFQLDGNAVQRIVLGGWRSDKGCVLVCKSDKKPAGLDLQFIEIG